MEKYWTSLRKKIAEKSLEDPHAPKNDSYASRVFQESSVGMVSSLYQTTSLPRKAFKIVALLLCLTGFFYQSGQFLAVVFQYPTTVDIDIVRPVNLGVPGYTFCDNNGINRRLFCEKFPERCQNASQAFCNRFEHYCSSNNSLVPMPEYYGTENNMTLEELVELNVDLEEFASVIDFYENITGPLLRKRDINGISYICYSVHDRVNNNLLPRMERKYPLLNYPVTSMKFEVRPDEMFLPGVRPGVLFSIHSPFDAVNPFENGEFMKPGRTYLVFVSMEEEVLLQKPYPTDCVNYTEMWENRGKSGPRTQVMCRHECLIDVSMKCFNCVVPVLLFPTKERFCRPEEIRPHSCPDNADDLFEECVTKCKDDCRRTKYTYKVQERFSPQLVENLDSEDEIDTRINVEVYLEEDEVVVLKHSPKYMIVEVFSSIGGFIGCWLGISLLDITDIFEGFFRIFRHSSKNKIIK